MLGEQAASDGKDPFCFHSSVSEALTLPSLGVFALGLCPQALPKAPGHTEALP